MNLCIFHHRQVHLDEAAAALDGWIVIGRDPAHAPFRGHRGWTLPSPDGTVVCVDFDLGRVVNLPLPQPPRRRKRVATRPQYDKRRRTVDKKLPRIA